VFAAILLGLVALAFVFWLVELTRSKIARRPPSWKRSYDPVPPDSLGRGMWASTKRRPPSSVDQDEE